MTIIDLEPDTGSGPNPKGNTMVTHRIAFGSRPGDESALVAFLVTEVRGLRHFGTDGEEFVIAEPLFVMAPGTAPAAVALANGESLRTGDMIPAVEIG